MTEQAKNWCWFLGLLALIIIGGIYLGKSRRSKLGPRFTYSLDKLRQVDPALIHYREVAAIKPTLKGLSALAIAPDGRWIVGGNSGVQIQNMAQQIELDAAPTCLAMDETGTLFIGEENCVRVCSPDGQQTLWPRPASTAYFTSIAVDDAFVFVADAGGRCIWRYPKAGGQPEQILGHRGFIVPSPVFDLALSPTDGSLWVVNPGYHALENYRVDGTFISEWEAASMRIEGFSGCCNPTHIALLADGGFVTAEKGLARVKVHDADGALRCVVAAPDQFADGIRGLDVAVDSTGRILALDRAQSQIRVFEEKQP